MQFKEGTPVYTADDEKVGDIERFVLDPRGQEVIGLVVRKGFLFREDKVIPVDKVSTADADRVKLYATAGDPDDFPLFEERHYVSPDDEDVEGDDVEHIPEPVYYYMPMGVDTWYAPVYPMPQPSVTERNIPEGTVPVKTGANVISRDGEHVGDVERIYTDATNDKITHFSIKQGLLFKDEKLIPAYWVDNAGENEVHLAVGAHTLEKLADF